MKSKHAEGGQSEDGSRLLTLHKVGRESRGRKNIILNRGRKTQSHTKWIILNLIWHQMFF